MVFLTYVLLPLLYLGTLAEDFMMEYYSTLILDCDNSKYNFTSSQHILKRYWLVPNGNLLSITQGNDQFEIDSNFTLTVKRIVDDDFGWYFCLIVRSDNTLDRIRHSVNIDGPFYGDLLDKYKKNAMIGGIAAGSLFVIMTGSCLGWQLRYRQRNQRNKAVDELDKAINGFDLKVYDNIGLELEDNIDKSAKGTESSDEHEAL